MQFNSASVIRSQLTHVQICPAVDQEESPHEKKYSTSRTSVYVCLHKQATNQQHEHLHELFVLAERPNSNRTSEAEEVGASVHIDDRGAKIQ